MSPENQSDNCKPDAPADGDVFTNHTTTKRFSVNSSASADGKYNHSTTATGPIGIGRYITDITENINLDSGGSRMHPERILGRSMNNHAIHGPCRC